MLAADGVVVIDGYTALLLLLLLRTEIPAHVKVHSRLFME